MNVSVCVLGKSCWKQKIRTGKKAFQVHEAKQCFFTKKKQIRIGIQNISMMNKKDVEPGNRICKIK